MWVLERLAELRVRLASIRIPSLTVPVVAVADVSPAALAALEEGTRRAIRTMYRSVQASERRLERHPAGSPAELERANDRLAFLQLRADALFRTLDVFLDGLSTRADAETGVLLRGTDFVVAAALDRRVPGYAPPLAVTYLDSAGRGGAIARARTEFPGGVVLPIALVRVSPETLPTRLTSLLHEAGHQLSSDLNVLEEGARVIHRAALEALGCRTRAALWASFASELLADVWGYVLGGVPAVDGLQRVLSLPAPLLYLVRSKDPHPPAVVRVAFGLEFTRSVHPDPLLDLLQRRFTAVYGSSPSASTLGRQQLELGRAVPAVARALREHRFAGLGRRTMVDTADPDDVAPAKLRRLVDRMPAPAALVELPPLTTLALLGTARLLGRLSADHYDLTARAWLRALARDRFRRGIASRPPAPNYLPERVAS
jgi:hypothetical protein